LRKLAVDFGREREYYAGKMGKDSSPKPTPATEVAKIEGTEVIHTEEEVLSSYLFLKPDFDGRVPAGQGPTASVIAMKTGKPVIVTRQVRNKR